MRKLLRIVGLLLIVGGLGTVAWAIVVWRWQDPFTAVYTKWEQHELGARLDRRMRAWRPPDAVDPPSAAQPATQRSAALARADVPAAEAGARDRPVRARRGRTRRPTSAQLALEEQALLKREAGAYRRSLHEGDPLGRITVPRLGLENMVVVDGTDEGSLEKGPGRYLGSYMPGEGQLIYIAGHRTTYLAPFSHIDDLRRGDRITLSLPYGRFTYAVTGSRIVPADDLAVLRSHGREVLILQACHPRFFATHRYLAYARLVSVVPRGGPRYVLHGARLAAA